MTFSLHNFENKMLFVSEQVLHFCKVRIIKFLEIGKFEVRKFCWIFLCMSLMQLKKIQKFSREYFLKSTILWTENPPNCEFFHIIKIELRICRKIMLFMSCNSKKLKNLSELYSIDVVINLIYVSARIQ